MRRFEMYEPLGQDRYRLVSIFDADSDHVEMIPNAPIVTLRRTDGGKPAPRPPRRTDPGKLVVQALNHGVPPAPDTFAAAVRLRRERGLL